MLSCEALPAWVPKHYECIPPVLRDDPKVDVDELIRKEHPIVFKKGSIVPISSWEDMGKLREMMAKTSINVKCSRNQNVAYFRSELSDAIYSFDPETYVREKTMPFADFVVAAEKAALKAKAREGNLENHSVDDDADADEDRLVLYCQETFNNHVELSDEFGRWDWKWVLTRSQVHNWGLPETNVLFMGTIGATTPCHFDEQHNFLNQVRGQKLAILFPPDDYTRMYPFPVTHPCDRSSMVDVRRPDLDKFPKFAQARGHAAVLCPGDMLYIPYGWFHYCSTLTQLGASITFWSKVAPLEVPNPLVPELMPPRLWLSIRRNIEKVLMGEVGAARLVGEINRVLRLIQQDVSVANQDPIIVTLRYLTSVVGVPHDEQFGFLLDTFGGRFEIDPGTHA